MNLDLILVFLVSIFFFFLAIHISALAMHRVSITDKPNDDHKHHDENIPFVGGGRSTSRSKFCIYYVD